INEFYSLYGGEQLPAIPLRYRDYAQWQKSETKTQALMRREAYWLEQFGGQIPVLTLPLDYPRPAKQGFEGDRIYFTIETLRTRQLNALAAGTEVTLYMLMLAIFNILLAKLSGKEDIVIGAPIAGRRHTDLRPLVGMFVNTLAIRHFPSGGKPFLTFLEEVKHRTLEAYENQDYPFEDLVEKLSTKITRDMSRNPLFDVVWLLHNEL
ncbi:MAG: hypothetical protein GY950_13025, partial [bacterium]|nr:hypothetical protein [bacterium]